MFRSFSHVKDVTATCRSAWLQVRNVLKCPQICTVINALSITVTVCLHVLVYHLISCAVKSKLYHSIPLTYSAFPHRLMGFCSPMNCGWVWLSTAWLVFFPLTSTSLSTTQSSILREPLSLDLMCKSYFQSTCMEVGWAQCPLGQPYVVQPYAFVLIKK